MSKERFTVDARIGLVVLFSIFFALIGPCKAQETGVRRDSGDDPPPRVHVLKDVKPVDPYLPPDIILAKDMSCEVEHPKPQKAMAPVFIVRCYVRYEDGRPDWKSPPLAMYDPDHEGSFWKADEKAHAEISKSERRISEAWLKARKR